MCVNQEHDLHALLWYTWCVLVLWWFCLLSNFSLVGPIAFKPQHHHKSRSRVINKAIYTLDLDIIWYNDALDLRQVITLILNSSDYQSRCYYITWFQGKLLLCFVRYGEHPYSILNGCVWHNGTRVCSSGVCYTKANPKPFDIATVSIDWGIPM